jgi:hypothetical protein
MLTPKSIDMVNWMINYQSIKNTAITTQGKKISNWDFSHWNSTKLWID